MRLGSVRKRIFLLYTLSVLLLCGATAAFLFIAEDRLIIEEAKENLAALTDSAVGDISFEDGRIVTDEHMKWNIEGTYLIVCDADGEILAGQVPEGFENTPGFEPEKIRKVRCGKKTYHVYDEPLDAADGHAGWVRGIAPEDLKEISPMLYTMYRWFIPVIPMLIALTLLAGWYITRRAFAPLGRIVNTAASIHEESDLSLRIGIGSPDSDDEILRTAGVFDRMLERIQKSFVRERQFANNASHELRTPVAVIMSQSEYALAHPDDPELTRRSLEQILRQSRKMSTLISRLLFLARADSGRQQIQAAKMDISLCAEESAAMLAEAAAGKRISVSVEAEEGIYINGDETLISQMFTNLISNGIKYGKQGGWVKVRIKSDRLLVSIRIDDNGCGIGPEELEHIWERFYRGDGAGRDTAGATENDASNDDSTGLGLPITKWIVEAHGGSIHVVSRRDEGTCFKISLPAYQE